MEASANFRYHIPVEDIPDEGLCLSYDDAPGLLAGIIDGPDPGRVLRVNACLNRVDDFIYVKGSIDVMMNLTCDRCLKIYPFEVKAPFAYLLVPGSAEKEGFDAANRADAEVLTYNGKEAPIGDILKEQILLQIPMRHVCNEECKGMCPGCGADLNDELCRCKKDVDNGPFSVLRGLKA